MSKIKYLNKDFGQFREALINHAKSYFPNAYRDFNESSPGMMFIEAASFVGDVLSMYNDHQLQESFINLATERKNIYNLAQNYGYKPNSVVPAQVELTVMQLVPALPTMSMEGTTYEPDMSYAFHIKEGMVVRTEDNVRFITTESCNFEINTPTDPLEISIYEISNLGEVTFYLLKKTVKAIAGQVFEQNFEFTTPKRYDKIVLEQENVSRIISVVDSESETWYEVDFMAQDIIPVSIRNDYNATSELGVYQHSVPFLLSYIQTDKRFVTRVRKDGYFEIQFGSGIGQESDEELVPNPFNVGLGIEYFRRYNDLSLDPANFINTKTYGSAPDNTTLTVKYLVSNGVSDNVGAETINIIESMEFYPVLPSLDEEIVEALQFSTDRGIKVTNLAPAYGGLNVKPLDVIKQEAVANFAAQNRAVTLEDILLRAYAMPAKFGNIAKAYVERDEQRSIWNSELIPNPYSINLFILAYDANGEFTPANSALKQNLSRYLSNYRLLTDAINIVDAHIIHIGIDFEIIVRPTYNSNEVLIRCIGRLKELFHQSVMEIGKPILLSKLYTELDKLEGVQTVADIKIYNKYDAGLGYSGNVYDINTATRDGIIYPSLDPSIFEIKFPDKDIKGKTINI